MLIEIIDRLSSRQRRAVAIVSDLVTLPLALCLTLALRHGTWQLDWPQFWPAFTVTVACVPLFAYIGLYRHVIRYIGSKALRTIFFGVTLTTMALAAVAYLTQLEDFPRSAIVIFWLLAFLYVAVTRFAVRGYVESVMQRAVAKKPVAIYGAGAAGARLAYQLQRDSGYRPLAFIDDDEDKHGSMVEGLPVYPVVALADLVEEHLVAQVLVAIPSASPDVRRRIVETLEPYPVRVRLMPELDAIVSGDPEAGLRDVDLNDLLGRDQVAPLPHLLHASVAGRVVLVTGAGGSIGSELCLQIMRLQPHRLILLEQTEFSLVKIENELRDLWQDEMSHEEASDWPVLAVLGSVLDSALMERTLRGYGVETVFHAAAYKHVDVVEKNVVQGIKNNTFGTLRTAQAALAAGVAKFILISTDKAVYTSNVMGASKRMAELVLQALQEQTKNTQFSTVRFGNVLVSSGSAVPLFLDQIDRGGPVTVTHAGATRYFMTLSEAAELVLQAASLGAGGDIFLLDMGKPVNILELAKKTIRLRGRKVRDEANPHGDIEIRFTGLRQGEKLNEDLLIGEAASGTVHRKIMRTVEPHLPWQHLQPTLEKLEKACDEYDFEAVRELVEALVENANLAQELNELPQRGTVLRLPT